MQKAQAKMAAPAPEEAVDTVWKAAAYGDFEKLTALAEAAPETLNQPDDQGYYALQWAALNNRVAILSHLIDKGCDLNATDSTGQTALHWSAVRGSTAAMETLLRAGADVRAADSRGYTLCHVAAQYGQSLTLYQLALRHGVDVDSPDLEGRTPLHWAAYKGFPDTLRLLLALGARCALPDNEGCTPLHWAAIRGYSEACTILLQGGAVDALTLADSTGATPSHLAIEKGHRMLGLHLSEYKLRREREARRPSGLAATLASLHLAPVIWGIVLGLLAMLLYVVIQNPAFPAPTGAMVGGAWASVLLASAGLYFLYRTTTTDPGYLPRNSGASRTASAALWEKELQRRSSGIGGDDHAGGSGGRMDPASLDSPALWAGHWNQLCVSCRIVRPLRAKHCPVADRCVQNYDHYCPWVGNVVGKGNRHLFLAFLWLELGAIAVSAGVAIGRLSAAVRGDGPDAPSGLALLWPIAFIVVDLFLLLSVAALAVAQASQVSRNMTTNEMANWHRYRYLHAPGGDFHNPFDKGCRSNCLEVCSPEATPMAPYMLATSGSGGGGDAETDSLLKMEQGGEPGARSTSD